MYLYSLMISVSYTLKRRPFLIPIIIMNGYNDIIAEPADDEELALACGFEIIDEAELYEMLTLSYHRINKKSSSSSSHRRGNGKLPPNKSISSFASAASSGVSSMMPKPMSSCSLSSQGSEMSDGDYYSSGESGGVPESDVDVGSHHHQQDGYQLSVENLWYIQQKRHHHHEEEEQHHHHFLTMEHASNHHNHNRLTEWFANLIHFPEKLRQHAADKHRFNINKIPKEVRDELKHIYVY